MSKRIKRFLISFVAAYMMFSMLATGRVDFVQDVYAASGDSVETIHNPALTYIHLFNYKGGSSRQANNTEGINNGHDLKFGRSGPNDGSPNSYKDGSGAITGIVRSSNYQFQGIIVIFDRKVIIVELIDEIFIV